MARAKVKLNYAGLKEIANSPEMHRAIQDLGEQVANGINDGGYVAHGPGKDSPAELRAEVEMKSDPAVAVVRVKHPAALAMQAKRGMFTKAAAEAGLKLKPPKGR